MSDVIFNEISRRLGENPALAKKVNAVISWNITKDGKKVTSWSKYIFTNLPTDHNYYLF